ncbi:pesticin C-terminus-like muramidase [Klebsiella quasipneumoniae]|uniref:pesticin C-terminus-like muramidase n=2 Tax=Klebsiella/Raoultella group TaxID=2890311 RepID=UPI001C4EAC43|nr:pesticin C-terminus-like muramidase [Klebsiella quasipneumoniae]MCJ7361399.1 pesticin C-terminus-like muramidase [Klebsiella quasipneumoniae]MDD9214317.1 pesticin C-terminus-like muramidase [Klebsiella quasipneumoniae]
MKISYPLRDTSGKEFRSLEDVMRLIDGEAHGTWLLGANGLWHGGIHISDISNPFSALNPDAVNAGDPVPLQFMADGTIVAYRLNNEYLTAPYCGQPLRYSSSFVLVKSQCQPDPQKEKSWLAFYSLYMHLAPVSDYPSSPCYKVRDGHSGILLRQYKAGQNGLPEGEPDNGEAGTYPAPAKTKKNLKAGDRFVSSRTGRFYVTKNGNATLTTFGLVRLLKENVPGKEQYWVTLDPELMEPDGEMQGLLPEWMQKAKQKGGFDSVELTGETEEWKVSAGTPVGFMGCMELPGEGNNLLDKEWFVHLEVLSTDPNMPGFLANPEKVKGDKRSVLAAKGSALFTRQDVTGQPVFTATSARLSAQCRLLRESAMPVADEAQKWWYKVSGSGWLPQSDVEEVSQYDLLKLGFQALEEDGNSDVMNSPYESWVPEAFGAISRSAEQEVSWQYGQVPQFYRDLMAEMGSNRDGKVTTEEIRQALAVRDPLVKDVVNRLVVKHHSEWCGGRSTGRWEGFYKDLDSLEVKYCEKWQADLEWMSKVPPFDKDEAVWHFHPVVFLDTITDKFTDVIEFQTTMGVYRISKKSAEFILSWEAYMPKPYVPAGDQSSGVTVGYGYDLGQQTTSSARALLSEYYSDSQVERLLSTIGKKGNEARAIVHELSDITIEKDKALDMAMVLKERYCQTVVDTYPQAISLPPDSAGAILSLVYNRGPSLALPKPGDPIDRRREMREIRDDFEQGNIKSIPERLRSMKRLWPNQRGLGLRRDGEAKLMENEISN